MNTTTNTASSLSIGCEVHIPDLSTRSDFYEFFHLVQHDVELDRPSPRCFPACILLDDENAMNAVFLKNGGLVTRVGYYKSVDKLLTDWDEYQREQAKDY